FNTVMQELIRSSYEPYSPVHRRGLFGDMNGAAIEEVRTGLINDGFWVFKERLGTDQIERLRAFGSTVDCLAETVSSSTFVPYEREHPRSVTYRVPEAELVKNGDVQN